MVVFILEFLRPVVLPWRFWVPFRYLCVLWSLPVFWYAFGALSVFHHRPRAQSVCRPHQSSVPRRSRPSLGHQWFRLIVVLCIVIRHRPVQPATPTSTDNQRFCSSPHPTCDDFEPRHFQNSFAYFPPFIPHVSPLPRSPVVRQ